MSFIDNLLTPFNQWLNALELRERRIVIAGAIALVIMLFYLVIWEPITSKHEMQQLQYNSQRQLYNWMKNASSEIRKIKSAGGSSASRFKKQSIASLVSRSAISSGVKGYIEKIDQSKKGVKVTFKAANFDSFVRWLIDLENKYAISASIIKIENTKVKGAIDAQVTLQRNSK